MPLASIDDTLVQWIATHRWAPLNDPFVWLGDLDRLGAIWVAFALALGLLRRLGPLRTAGLMVLTALTTFAADSASFGVKDLVHRARPFVAHPEIQPLYSVHSSSFPAGHAATSFAGATLLTYLAPRAAPLFFGLAGAIGFSRVYVGVHYPGDVLAGAGIGAAVGAAAILLLTVGRTRVPGAWPHLRAHLPLPDARTRPTAADDAGPREHRSGGRRSGNAWLIVNPRSGDDSPTTAELVDAAQAQGIRCHVLRDGEDPGAVTRAAKAAVLGVAGGDGSLAPVATVALERNLPFVCIPFGTRNHFARDLDLDRNDPISALSAFSCGTERRIDVGRVNERLFLNNVSLGLYAGLVLRRERHRRRGELLAALRALARVARDHHTLHASLDGQALRSRVLLIANNAYELKLYNLGERASLDEGKLHLYSTDGLLPTSWTELAAPSFVIKFEKPHVLAAADGEPLILESPLRVNCLPRALRVLVPPDAAEDGR